MKKKILYITILTALLIPASCTKWLDVTPPSQVREEDQFNTVAGFQQALTGCYIGMTDDMLYGKALTWSTIELMAGQFVQLQPLASNDYYISRYNYTTANAIKYIDGIWAKSYSVISNVNNALKYIEIKRDVLDNINYNLIKGELLTIRAFMHFDLMRLYGFSNLGNRTDLNAKFTIPYVTTLGKEMAPQRTYKQTIDLMVKDLQDAIVLLEEDPATKVKPDSYYTEVNIDGFYTNRKTRFNYYATSLLLARVYMWEGSKESYSKALTLANKVISEAESKGLITWATTTSVTDDMIMKSEHLMALSTQNLAVKTAEYFRTQILADQNTFAQYISADRLISIYDAEGSGSNDFRFQKQFIVNSVTLDGKSAYTPLKYFGTVTNNIQKNLIPLIRFPEAYYIAAECLLKQNTPDAQSALNLLNTARTKRGLAALTNLTSTQIMNEIVKEYNKEFYCEGHMFFLYKRLGMENIPGYNESATDAVYTLPYPSAEIQMGRTQ